jgi:hypothetical protein
MKLVRTYLSFAVGGCAILAALTGCMAPWTTPFAKPAPKRATTGAAQSVAIPPVVTPVAAKADSNPADMAGVMDKLAQVREMDPAAEEKLLEELRRTPPNSWPLVAEQFRATLAMHQQLAGKPAGVATTGSPMSAFHRSAAKGTGLDSAATSEDLSHITSLTGSNPPSAKIGNLVDPRDTSSNAEPLVVQDEAAVAAKQKHEVSPPADFAASGPVYPIDGQKDSSARQAAYETRADNEIHVGTQALGGADAVEAPKRLPKPDDGASHPGKPLDLRSAGDGDWQRLVEKAADELSQRVAASPTTTAEVHQHVSLRLLRLLAGETEKALEPIPHIPPAEQDYWSRQIFAIATYLDHHSQPDDKRRAAASVGHLDEAVSHLRELGSLSLRNLSFCKNVYGYGAFEPYDADTFKAGEQVSLYVEVENYHSSSSDKGYCTLLGATYEILDDKGKRVSGGEFPDVDDYCRSRRRDFHIQFGLTLPENLPPGRYRVELVVKDRQSDKLGHASAPFEIRAGRK